MTRTVTVVVGILVLLLAVSEREDAADATSKLGPHVESLRRWSPSLERRAHLRPSLRRSARQGLSSGSIPSANRSSG